MGHYFKDYNFPIEIYFDKKIITVAPFNKSTNEDLVKDSYMNTFYYHFLDINFSLDDNSDYYGLTEVKGFIRDGHTKSERLFKVDTFDGRVNGLLIPSDVMAMTGKYFQRWFKKKKSPYISHTLDAYMCDAIDTILYNVDRYGRSLYKPYNLVIKVMYDTLTDKPIQIFPLFEKLKSFSYTSSSVHKEIETLMGGYNVDILDRYALIPFLRYIGNREDGVALTLKMMDTKLVFWITGEDNIFNFTINKLGFLLVEDIDDATPYYLDYLGVGGLVGGFELLIANMERSNSGDSITMDRLYKIGRIGDLNEFI